MANFRTDNRRSEGGGEAGDNGKFHMKNVSMDSVKINPGCAS
jgi:hypothetical protein